MPHDAVFPIALTQSRRVAKEGRSNVAFCDM
jgi:hypothetical protein